jgi:hypothetical protein
MLKQIHTHTCTHTIRVHSQKHLLNYTHRAVQWNDEWYIFSLVSVPLQNWIFVTCPLILVVAISQENLTDQYWRFFEFYTKCFCFSLCCSPLLSILLVRKPSRCSTFLIPEKLALLPKPERHSFTPDRVTRMSDGRWSASPPAS